MEPIRELAKKKVPVIEVDEGQLRSHVAEVVRQSVEDTLNSLLDAEWRKGAPTKSPPMISSTGYSLNGR